jgi:hypothetical protein
MTNSQMTKYIMRYVSERREITSSTDRARLPVASAGAFARTPSEQQIGVLWSRLAWNASKHGVGNLLSN